MKANGYSELEGILLERLTDWMTKKLKFGPGWIEEFEERYRQRVLVTLKRRM